MDNTETRELTEAEAREVAAYRGAYQRGYSEAAQIKRHDTIVKVGGADGKAEAVKAVRAEMRALAALSRL